MFLLGYHHPFMTLRPTPNSIWRAWIWAGVLRHVAIRSHSGFKWTPPKQITLPSKVKMPEYYDGTTFSGPIPLEKVKVEYVCSSGAGGQHVNKTASKACLSFNVLEATWLPKWIRHRLLVKAKTHVNKQGILLVTCDSERTQSFNLREARSKIESLIKEASRLPNERTVEDEKAIVRSMHRQNMNRLRNKKHASALKRSRTDFD